LDTSLQKYSNYYKIKKNLKKCEEKNKKNSQACVFYSSL